MTSREQKRRLCVVGAMFSLAILALWGRLVQVQYFGHDRYREIAIKQRESSREVPAVRGGIFDRNGRPLAMNIRRCSIAVQPDQVHDARAVVSVLSRTIGVSAAAVRQSLRSGKSFVYVKHDYVLNDTDRAQLAKLPGVVVEMNANRIYPYDTVGSKVVGFVSRDNRGLSGIEVAYDDALRGTPGRETVIRNGSYRSDRYVRLVDVKPHDGKHVYLTIDATVQDIAETELRRAVDETGARGGAVIIMEVATGDILALAEAPSIRDREGASFADSLWTLASVSHVYEPGSTFKLVTAAALLDKSNLTPADSFNAEDGEADLGFARIRDAHAHHGWLTVREAFVLSSNIVMAKASGALSAGDFYGYARLFGFGSKTGIGLPGESAGSVPPIDRWSARTKATMAFGQEVAVTPIQMLTAFAAVANDGVMMMPRLVKAVADPTTGEVSTSDPVVVRRVVSEETARTLREYCLGVVEEGTATSAQVEFMRVAGKTGTAQKAGHRGYVPNKYISSFVGFAPYEHPKIACIVMLDEPRWSLRYGGDSAAPVFAQICRSLACATPIFDDVLSVETLQVATTNRRTRGAPNFLRMGREAALDAARQAGANVLVQGNGDRVVAQVPGPGATMNRDDVIRLVVSAGSDGGRARLSVDANERIRESYRNAVLSTAEPVEPDNGPGTIARVVSIAGQAAASALSVATRR
jgi:stage V sporulation protein D (sporulation-specific penicillin-binding protein)